MVITIDNYKGIIYFEKKLFRKNIASEKCTANGASTRANAGSADSVLKVKAFRERVWANAPANADSLEVRIEGQNDDLLSVLQPERNWATRLNNMAIHGHVTKQTAKHLLKLGNKSGPPSQGGGQKLRVTLRIYTSS